MQIWRCVGIQDRAEIRDKSGSRLIMLHDKFDLAKWIKIFSLSDIRREVRERILNEQREYPTSQPSEEKFIQRMKSASPGGEFISGPYQISMVEQIRAEAIAGQQVAQVPTDVFIWSIGEPQTRSLTKVGGLPYWPSCRPWPRDRSNCEMVFVAQFGFADSLDIVDKLPGDILLIFSAEDDIENQIWDPNILKFEWQNIVAEPLVNRIPVANFTLSPFYGSIHRTVDYVNAEAIFSAYKRPYLLDVIYGTKIGGLKTDPDNRPNIKKREDLKVLCSLSSISSYTTMYPYVNVERYSQIPENRGSRLYWADVGAIDIFYDKHKGIRAVEHFF